MIISNEFIKRKIELLFQMDQDGQHPSFNSGNIHHPQENLFFQSQRHEIQINKEEQHQAYLVQMAQNFQAQMNEMIHSKNEHKGQILKE